MLLGQSKVARVEEGRNKPVHCLHQSVLHGALNPIRADLRFCYYTREKLTSASVMYDGTQLNWYLPRTMGGLGMKLPDGVQFCSENDYYNNNLRKGSQYRVLTDRQRVIAYGLRDAWYVDNLQSAPFKPIGMEIDPDLQNWGSEIKKHIELKAQLIDCPMLPDCEEIPMETHDPNWYLPYTGSIEKECLKYIFSGLSWKRFALKSNIYDGAQMAMLNKRCHNGKVYVRSSPKGDKFYNMIALDNVHLYQEIKLYKKRSDRTGYTCKVIEKCPIEPMEVYME
jgi:hypothetical protein